MNCRPHSSRAGIPIRGLTLIEFLVAIGIGTLVLTVSAALTIYGSRTLAAMVNYSELDQKSRLALDVMTREIRQATRVTAVTTNATFKQLTLTNVDQAAMLRYTWTNKTMIFEKTGHPTVTNLTECDRWNFSLYLRVPNVTSTNITFFSATNLNDCKLIDMSWKCSRKIVGVKLNTESVQTAQIVLRNKP